MHGSQDWPELPLDAWKETYATLHMWTQIVGKVRLGQTVLVNHWWNVVFYVTPAGLTTSFIPYGTGGFEVRFDFREHRLVVEATNGTRSMALRAVSVAEFYREFMDLLHALGIDVSIWPVPVEVETRIPFDEDDRHRAYDPEYADRLRWILVQSERVLQLFRARFIGKCSPVHFFWGAFDMALTRFSGRPAPPHPPAPFVAHRVVAEAYSHEVSSCGFWPGGGPVPEPAYYAYAYPEPEGFAAWNVAPDGAFYAKEMGEYILPYGKVRSAPDPDAYLLTFLESTYAAAAETGNWDRATIERRETHSGRFG